MPEAGIPDLVEGAMGDGCTPDQRRASSSPSDFEELYKAAL